MLPIEPSSAADAVFGGVVALVAIAALVFGAKGQKASG